jgi:hypothetical protein
MHRSIRLRQLPSRWLSPCLALVLISAVTGCQEEGEPGSLCDWVEEEVPLDYSLGPWGGDLSYDLQPGKILELLTVPLEGTLTWNGGGNWADMTPSEGMTGFSSSLTYDGSTVYRRVPGATGELSLACRATLDFQSSINMRTDDGVLDETWEAVVSFDIHAHGISTEIDPEAVGLIDALQVVPNPDPPTPYHDESYWMLLSYNVYPFSPELPATSSGRVYFRGKFESTQDGEITELSGFNRLLAEWVGFEVQ